MLGGGVVCDHGGGSLVEWMDVCVEVGPVMDTAMTRGSTRHNNAWTARRDMVVGRWRERRVEAREMWARVPTATTLYFYFLLTFHRHQPQASLWPYLHYGPG